jgi:hypothetical protein
VAAPLFRFRAAHPHEGLAVVRGDGGGQRTAAAAALLAHGAARAAELRRQV